MKEGQPITLDQKALNQQARLGKSGEPGVARRGFNKGLDVAAKLTWITLPASAGIWAAGEFAPGAVAGAGFNPESAKTLGKTGVIVDLVGLVGIKALRGKNTAGSQSVKQEGFLKSTGKGAVREIVAFPKEAVSQVNPLPKAA